MDNALLRWFKEVREDSPCGVTGYDLLQKALDFARQLGQDASNIDMSWINRWKTRHGVVCRTIAGESKSADVEQVSEWRNTALQHIVAEFCPSDIYNVDETALFWETFPKKTLAFRGEECKGEKIAKNRVTFLVGANMAGK